MGDQLATQEPWTGNLLCLEGGPPPGQLARQRRKMFPRGLDENSILVIFYPASAVKHTAVQQYSSNAVVVVRG